MSSRLMFSRAAAIALRALVELAREPAATLSVAELARRQQLPQPMLEQILLRLRRAGLVEARRGRHGGYRLAQQAETLPLARVLQAVEVPRWQPQPRSGKDSVAMQEGLEACAEGMEASAPPWIAAGLGEGLVDHPTALATGPALGGMPDPSHRVPASEPADNLEASAGHRVEEQLRRRLERLVQRELQRLTLAELLYDQRSWEASLGPEGGVMLS